MNMMVEACSSAATDCEATSVAQIKELYNNLGNPPGNIDVIYDGTWLTQGHSSHVAVGCIIEMYTGLVVDHIIGNADETPLTFDMAPNATLSEKGVFDVEAA
ncbi:hypothetical protein HPB49_020800 [Dermacentor silvarum]|uniref:Uncharacterized protein n=1 Tax=Dermacentor silvarum TaxID=543639 RepID=A0ACB8DL07_DERSI|nr:hypothetical protein HPB49_020800 [Dermacentor silvarum]